MATPLKIDRWKSWQPGEYLREYCHKVEPDDKAAIEFQVRFLQRVGREHPRALEYGCGPTLMRAIAASPYVAALDMADKVDINLRHVRRWASGDSTADDWSRFTDYVLRCEGVTEPSREEVQARENHTRSVLSGLLLTDARDRLPLGQARVARYDLLISGFCLDCLSESKVLWRRCMRNVFKLLKPGGSFVVLALRGCEGYRVGEHWFPAANIQSGDLKAALVECGADQVSLEIAQRELPGHASQGYRGILLASGQTTAIPAPHHQR